MPKNLLGKALDQTAKSKITTRSLCKNSAFHNRDLQGGGCGCQKDKTATGIVKAIARIYSGRKLDFLSVSEQSVIGMLEKAGYIIPNKPDDGFVGKAQK